MEHDESERCWCRPSVLTVKDGAGTVMATVTAHNVDTSVPIAVQLESARFNETDTEEHYWSCRCRRCMPDDDAPHDG